MPTIAHAMSPPDTHRITCSLVITPDCPVYEVQSEDGQGRTRVLHQNLLLPCDFLPVESHKPEKKRGERTHKEKKTLTTQNRELRSSSDCEEDDWQYLSRWPQGDSTAPTRSNLRPEATEFHRIPTQAATPGLEGDNEITEQTQWTSDVDNEQEEQIGTELDNKVTVTAGPSEDIEDAELETASNDGEVSPPSSPAARQYPFRNRHAPKTLTYDRLGQPTVKLN